MIAKCRLLFFSFSMMHIKQKPLPSSLCLLVLYSYINKLLGSSVNILKKYFRHPSVFCWKNWLFLEIGASVAGMPTSCSLLCTGNTGKIILSRKVHRTWHFISISLYFLFCLCHILFHKVHQVHIDWNCNWRNY